MAKKKIKEILYGEDLSLKRALFGFTINTPNKRIIKKFNYWAKYHYPQYFTSKDAWFHKLIDWYNLLSYKGKIRSFLNIAFRGAAKTARTKLFVAFVIANDLEHFRKYIKILAFDRTNSKQFTTDIYNMLIIPEIVQLYPELFAKTDKKREETMNTFTTGTGVKVLADTVGTDQRGALQEESRPDWILFDDFENRKTLKSLIITKTIEDNMEEARTSLANGGSCIYCCNYISEAGNVHKLVEKESEDNIVLIIPIITKIVRNALGLIIKGKIAWDRYSLSDINIMEHDDLDFEGERLCEPSAGPDILFNRDKLNSQKYIKPIEVDVGLKIFYKATEKGIYASGNDVGGGIGLDSSTSVHIDFSTIPARVVATFKSNTILPELFGDEIHRQQGIYYGVAGIENNFGTDCILKARQLGTMLYSQAEKEDTKININSHTKFGWNTNSLTKSKMINSLMKAVKNGLLELTDEDIKKECWSYSRNDLLDKDSDPRLTTRHFDLLMATAIAWQMKEYALLIGSRPIKKGEEKSSWGMTPDRIKKMKKSGGFDISR